MLTKKTHSKRRESFVEGLMHILVKQGKCSHSEAKVIIQSFYDADAYEFDAFLVDEGLINVASMLSALEEYYKVPYFDVVGYFFDKQLLHKFPKYVMLQYGFIPLEDNENTMVVIASDPANSQLLVEIGKYVSYDIQFRVGLHHDILDAVKEFYDSALTEQRDEDDMYDSESQHKNNEAVFEETEDSFFDEDEDTIDFA
ncbi:hypothetical protein EKK58_05030 [Candidatus Dependentiae bacterium]|nr:MAG: hypothetical protein EKK58_05030 [Candidatus Dependentiae bacterium]